MGQATGWIAGAPVRISLCGFVDRAIDIINAKVYIINDELKIIKVKVAMLHPDLEMIWQDDAEAVSGRRREPHEATMIWRWSQEWPCHCRPARPRVAVALGNTLVRVGRWLQAGEVWDAA